jgi:hypothetical protein
MHFFIYICLSNSNSSSTNAINSFIVSLEKSKRIPAASYTSGKDSELPRDNAFL